MKKKESRSKYVHPDRIQRAHTFAVHVFFRKQSRFGKQQFERAEKLTVKMCEVVEKMHQQMPDTFSWLYVLLPAMRAEPVTELRSAIKTNFFLSFRQMRHSSGV